MTLALWWLIGILLALLAGLVNKRKLRQDDIFPVLAMGLLGPIVAVLWGLVYYCEERR